MKLCILYGIWDWTHFAELCPVVSLKKLSAQILLQFLFDSWYAYVQIDWDFWEELCPFLSLKKKAYPINSVYCIYLILFKIGKMSYYDLKMCLGFCIIPFIVELYLF